MMEDEHRGCTQDWKEEKREVNNRKQREEEEIEVIKCYEEDKSSDRSKEG